MPLWGDYDNDGFIDLFLSTGYHSGPQNDRLYHNEGGVAFRTMTAAEVGVAVSDNAQDQAFGWIDYDNDGDLDLFVTYMAPPFDSPASEFCLPQLAQRSVRESRVNQFRRCRPVLGRRLGGLR